MKTPIVILVAVIVVLLAVIVGGAFYLAQPAQQAVAPAGSTGTPGGTYTRSGSTRPTAPPARTFVLNVNDTSANLRVLAVAAGTPVTVTINVAKTGTSAKGLEFKSGTSTSGVILPGASKTLHFTATRPFTLTPYTPGTSTPRPYSIKVVVQ